MASTCNDFTSVRSRSGEKLSIPLCRESGGWIRLPIVRFGLAVGRLVVTSLVICSTSARGTDLQKEEKLATKELREIQRLRLDISTEARDLRLRLQKVESAGRSSEHDRTKKAFEETQDALTTVTEQEHWWQSRLLEIRSSPLYRIEKAVSSDKRRPKRTNISGVWTSDTMGTGFTFQLEQKGTHVTGQGYGWGCIGTFKPFRVTGSYTGDMLSLTFDDSIQKADLKYSPIRGRPRFEGRFGKHITAIIPASGSR